MPHYTVTSPDGSDYEVDAPEGGTKEQAIQYVQGELAAGRLKPKAKVAGFRGTLDPMRQAAQEATGESSGQLGQLRPDFASHPLQTLSDINAGINIPYRALGNAVMEATGSPALSALAYGGSQVVGPGLAVAVAKRAVSMGRIAAKDATAFADILRKRVAKEGVTGWKDPQAVTSEQIDEIARSLEGPPKFPSKPVKTPEQKAGGKKKSVATPEEITGDPTAGNLDDVLPKVREGPRVGAMPDLPAQEFPKTTLPEAVGGPQEPRPAGTKPVRPMRDEQGGKINPALAAKLASTTAGAVIGAGLDPNDPIQGAAVGALAGWTVGHSVSVRVSGRAFGDAVQAAVNPAAQLNQAKRAEIAVGIRAADQTAEKLKALNIPENRGLTVIRALQSGDTRGLLPKEIEAAQLLRAELDRLGGAAQEAGAIPNLKRNFVPQLWDTADKKTREVLKRLGLDLAKQTQRRGFSTFTPHQLEQTISSYDQGIALGLKPKTLKLDELFGQYANSVIRATENKRAVTELANLKNPADGKPLVLYRGKDVPGDWVSANGGDVHVPELEGFFVHPDIADSVRLGFSSYDPNILARAAIQAGWFAKRMQVSLSMFHPKALLEAHSAETMRFGVNPLKWPGEVATSVGRAVDPLAGAVARGAEKLTGDRLEIPYQSGADSALRKYRTGGPGDLTDILLRGGLNVKGGIEDVGGFDALQQTMKKIGQVPGLGLPSKAVAAVDAAHQKFTWGYIFTGQKLNDASALFEREFMKDAKAAEAAGRQPKPVAQLAEEVSAHINSLYGGLDWERIAEGVQNKYGKQIAYFLASPRGQSYMSMVAYAPDWAVSTMQPWVRAMGISGTQATQRYAQGYLAKALVMELVIGDAVNLQYSGHHLWENDFHKGKGDTLDKINDMTYIDRNDGTKQQMFKHLNEFLHLLTEPDKFVMNKTGYLPRTAYEVLFNKKYPSVGFEPRIAEPWDSRELNYAKRLMYPFTQMTPITGQGMMMGADRGVAGYLGAPVYGLTKEDKQDLKRQRTESRRESR
jgi:hypothetical protein